MPKLMQCGHAANATDGNGKECCVICIGIHPGYNTPMKQAPDLSAREACCSYSLPGRYYRAPETGIEKLGRHAWVKSSTDLAFFEHRPDEPYDTYFCGCWGWD